MWNRLREIAWNWRGVILTVPSVTLVVIALRLTGWLQPLEWAALDLLFQLRPLEPPDERIVIVSMKETDIQKLGQWPISDRDLAQLLKQIKAQQPKVIGLALYRDLPVEPGHEELVKVFRNTPNLIGIEKVIEDSFYAKINPPPVLEELGQVSASDLIVDGDGVLRRIFLFPMAPSKKTLPSLGLAVALKYLKQVGIIPTTSEDGEYFKLGNAVFSPFNKNDGGYVRADDGGYQILLNFRGPAHSFLKVSFTDVLKGHFEPEFFRDRIVLIGSMAASTKDHFYTPYSKGTVTNPTQTYNVEIQANLASQILSTVIENRPLIKVWSNSGEYSWICGWSAFVAILGWQCRRIRNVVQLVTIILGGVLGATLVLVGSSYYAFLFGWWLPIIPSLLSLGCSTIVIIAYINASKLEEYNLILKAEVRTRTCELESTLQKLRAAQEKIVIQEKLAALGTLVAGVSHELKNPLHFISNFTELSVDLIAEIREEIEQYLQPIGRKITNNTYELLDTLEEDLVEIREYSQRANTILQTMLPHTEQQNREYELTNIHSLLNSAIRLVFYSQKNKWNNFEIKLEKDYDLSIGKIEIIAQEVSRALINIIDNAYYTLQEKAKVSSRLFVPTISFKTQNLNKAIAIIIRDNGQGIPKEIANKVFDPFFTTKPPRAGMGLGLSIAYNLITERHRGEITLETAAGYYTEFTIVLPKKPTFGKLAIADNEFSRSQSINSDRQLE